MKRVILAMICLLAFAALLVGDISRAPRKLPSPEQGIGTEQYGYEISRTVTANDTALTTTTSSWANIGTVFHQIPQQWSNITITFYAYGDGDGAGSPADGTFDFTIYAARRYGAPITVCSANDAVFGAMQLSHNPVTGAEFNSGAVSANYTWMDTYTLTDVWLTSVQTGDNGGNDTLAELAFDPLGCKGIYIIVTDMTNVTSVTYVITGCGG